MSVGSDKSPKSPKTKKNSPSNLKIQHFVRKNLNFVKKL